LYSAFHWLKSNSTIQVVKYFAYNYHGTDINLISWGAILMKSLTFNVKILSI